MTVENIILHCKEQFNNNELDENERDKYLFVGNCLVELLALRNMYKDDISRFDAYYKNIEKIVDDLEKGECE